MGLKLTTHAFLDEPLIVAEIGNEFHGVDCIDLSDWSGQDLAHPRWEELLKSMRVEQGHDYVFLVYTERPSSACALARSIIVRCGIASLLMSLLPPSVEALCARFSEGAGGLGADEVATVSSWIEGLIKAGKMPNYAFVDAIASMIGSFWEPEDGHDKLRELLDMHAALAPSAKGDQRIGF